MTAADGLELPHERVAVASWRHRPGPRPVAGDEWNRRGASVAVLRRRRFRARHPDDRPVAEVCGRRAVPVGWLGQVVRTGKGRGMISPSFATMLCFVETDAAVDSQTLERLLDAAVERSFERISVDGQLSTNDSLFMMANAASGIARRGSGRRAGIRRCARRPSAAARDRDRGGRRGCNAGGASRGARWPRRGGAGCALGRQLAARQVRPVWRRSEWGRLLAAAGQALPNVGEVEFDLSIEEVEVARSSGCTTHRCAGKACR